MLFLLLLLLLLNNVILIVVSGGPSGSVLDDPSGRIGRVTHAPPPKKERKTMWKLVLGDNILMDIFWGENERGNHEFNPQDNFDIYVI